MAIAKKKKQINIAAAAKAQASTGGTAAASKSTGTNTGTAAAKKNNVTSNIATRASSSGNSGSTTRSAQTKKAASVASSSPIPESKVTVPTVSAQRSTETEEERNGWRNMAGWLLGAPFMVGNRETRERANTWTSNVGESAAKGYAADLVGGFTTTMNALNENVIDRQGQYDIERQRRDEEIARLQDERSQYIEYSRQYGHEPDATVLADYDRQLAELSPETQRQETEAGIRRGEEERERLAGIRDRLSTEGADAAQRAKDAANRSPLLNRAMPLVGGTVGDFLTNSGVAGAQMIGDVGIGALTGGGAMAPMMLRSFGGGASEAAREGKDVNEQLYEGAKSAAVAWATEHLFGGNPVYDQGTSLAESALTRVLGEEGFARLTNSMASRIAKVPMSMLEEALEEASEDYLSPFIDSLRNLVRGEGWNYENPEASEVWQDALTGGLLALGGQVGNIGNRSAQATEAAQTQAQTEGTYVLPTQEADVKRGMQEPVEDIVARAMVPEAAEAQAPVENTDPAVDVITQAALGEQAAQPEQAQAPMTLEERQSALEARFTDWMTRRNEVEERGQMGGAVTSEELDALEAEYQQINDEAAAINAERDAERLEQETQEAIQLGEQRAAAGDVSTVGGRVIRGTPENHIDNRSYETVGIQKGIRAFQFDHPELHRFYVPAAEVLLMDAERSADSVHATKTRKGNYVNHVENSPLTSRAKDLGLSMPQVIKACEAIIADNGQENYAAAKKVEMLLDEMLSHGYASFDSILEVQDAIREGRELDHGSRVPANQEYIEAKKRIAGSKDAANDARRAEMTEWERYLEDSPYSSYDISERARAAEMFAEEHPDLAWQAELDNQRFTIEEREKRLEGRRRHLDLLRSQGLRVEQAEYDALAAEEQAVAAERAWYENEVEQRNAPAEVQAEQEPVAPEAVEPEAVPVVSDERLAELASLRRSLKDSEEVVASIRQRLESLRSHGVELNEFDYNHLADQESLAASRRAEYESALAESGLTDEQVEAIENAAPSVEEAPVQEAEAEPLPGTRPTIPEPTLPPRAEGLDWSNTPRRGNRVYDESNPVSKSYETVMHGEPTSEQMQSLMDTEDFRNMSRYIAKTNQGEVDSAIKYIRENGYARSMDTFIDAANNGAVSPELMARGALLMKTANELGRGRDFADLYLAYKKIGTRAGQTVQASQIWDRMSRFVDGMATTMTPADRVYMMRKAVAEYNEQIRANKWLTPAQREIQLEIDEALVDEFMRAETDEQRDAISDEIRNDLGMQAPRSFLEVLTNWRYFSMLFNLRTHARNIAGNLLSEPVVAIKDKVSLALQQGLIQDPSQRTQAQINVFGKDRANYQYAKHFYDQYIKGQDDGSKWYEDRGKSIIDKYKPAFKSKFFSRLTKLNSWALDAEDYFHSKPAFARQMAREMKIHGITGADIEAGRADAATVQDMIQRATEYSQVQTFRDNSALAQFLVKEGAYRQGDGALAAGKALVYNTSLPFKRTPANILNRAWQYSPIGLAVGTTQLLTQVRNGKMTAAQAIDQIAQGVTGTGLMALGIALAKMGHLTGGDDDDKEQNAFNRLRGWQKNSYKFGGKYISAEQLGIGSVPMLIGAEIYNRLTDGYDDKFSLSDALKTLGDIANPVLETTMLSSINDIMNDLSYAQDGEWLGVIARSVAGNLVGSFFPTLGGAIERAAFEDARDTTFTQKGNAGTLHIGGEDGRYIDVPDIIGLLPENKNLQYEVGNILNRVPGIDYNQIPYIDAWGREQDTGDWWERIINNFINPANATENRDTGVELVLQRLYDAGYHNVFPERASQSTEVNGHTLTAPEYVNYQRTLGQTSLSGLEELMSSSAWKGLTDEQRAAAIGNVYSMARYAAAKRVDGDTESDESIIKNADEIKRTYGWNNGEYAAAYATYGASFLTNDTTKKMYEAGVPIDSWYSIDSSIASLPHAGSKVQDWQKLLAISESNLTGKQKETYYEGILTARSDTPWAEYKDVVAGGGTMLDFVSGHGYSSYEGHEDPSYYTVSSEQTTRPTSSRTKSKKDTIDSEPEDDTGWLARLFSGTLAG